MLLKLNYHPLVWFLSFTDLNTSIMSLQLIIISYILTEATESIRILSSGLQRNVHLKEYLFFPMNLIPIDVAVPRH